MDLLIAILLWCHVIATPDTIDNPEFRETNAVAFDHSRQIIDNRWYSYGADGGVVVDVGVSF
jgi:hypothetical protein